MYVIQPFVTIDSICMALVYHLPGIHIIINVTICRGISVCVQSQWRRGNSCELESVVS